MLGSLVEQSSEWYFDISKIILKLIISKSKFTFSTGTLSNCWDYDNFWTYTCVKYSLLLGKEEISIYRKWIHTSAEWHDSMRPCMSCQWAGQACETGGTSGIFGRSYLTTAPAALRNPRPLHSPFKSEPGNKGKVIWGHTGVSLQVQQPCSRSSGKRCHLLILKQTYSPHQHGVDFPQITSHFPRIPSIFVATFHQP